jgi:hypothetical protein
VILLYISFERTSFNTREISDFLLQQKNGKSKIGSSFPANKMKNKSSSRYLCKNLINMKLLKQINYNRMLFFLIVVSGTLLLQSCARKITFGTSPVVPAAEGSVKVKKDKNNNYNIDLDVKRLADPNRLVPAKNTYVVWMDTERNGTKNLGQLKTSSGLFSSTLKSSLETVTPFKPTRFFITAEDNTNEQYPDGVIVLSTTNF